MFIIVLRKINESRCFLPIKANRFANGADRLAKAKANSLGCVDRCLANLFLIPLDVKAKLLFGSCNDRLVNLYIDPSSVNAKTKIN